MLHDQLKGREISDSWKTAFLWVRSALMNESFQTGKLIFFFIASYLISFLGYSLIPMEGCCSYPASPAPSLI